MANPLRLAPASQDFSTLNVFPGSLRRCLPGLLLFSFCIFGSPIGQAQEQQVSGQQQDQGQQTQDQDVAKAAREERARKQANPGTPRHVYTAEDLKRDQILTPEDRAMFEASRRQWTPLITTPSQDAMDAQSLPPDAPLGDIARSLQRQKELMKLRRSNEFHLTIPESPVFASPKPPTQPIPLRPPVIVIEPERPRVVGPFHPPVKRSPFERPRLLPSAPAVPHESAPALPQSLVTPASPKAPHAFAATPSSPRVSSKKPRTSMAAPEIPRDVAPAPIAPQAAVVTPKAPHNFVPAKPVHPAVKAPGGVFPAPDMPHAAAPAAVAPEASPVAPKAPHNFVPAKPSHPAVNASGTALPAPEMPRPAAPAVVAPDASPFAPKAPRNFVPVIPSHPASKTPPAVVPAPPVYRVAPATPSIPVAPPIAPANPNAALSNKVITVQPGDSLWKIAEQHLGNGLRWHELLSVNPGISDPARILAGSQLVLPSVSGQRATKYTVLEGDSLWSIAQSHLGRATAWSCVAKANPQIANANFIREGQVLSLPSSCPR